MYRIQNTGNDKMSRSHEIVYFSQDYRDISLFKVLSNMRQRRARETGDVTLRKLNNFS